MPWLDYLFLSIEIGKKAYVRSEKRDFCAKFSVKERRQNFSWVIAIELELNVNVSRLKHKPNHLSNSLGIVL